MNPLRGIGVHAAAKIARGSSANHPMKAFDVSILILNWNGSAMLAQFLPSCLTSSQRYDVEVVWSKGSTVTFEPYTTSVVTFTSENTSLM